MDHRPPAPDDGMDASIRDASASLADLADRAVRGIGRAHGQLDAALVRGRAALRHACATAIIGTRAAARFVRAHPYLAVGVVLGLGVILGSLVAPRRPKSE